MYSRSSCLIRGSRAAIARTWSGLSRRPAGGVFERATGTGDSDVTAGADEDPAEPAVKGVLAIGFAAVVDWVAVVASEAVACATGAVPEGDVVPAASAPPAHEQTGRQAAERGEEPVH